MMSTISPLPPLPLSPSASDMPDREHERERDRPSGSSSHGAQSQTTYASSRPLSEISENESYRRSNRSSVHSRKDKEKDKGEQGRDSKVRDKENSSRPTSQVLDEQSLPITATTTPLSSTSTTTIPPHSSSSTASPTAHKRLSTTSAMPVQTITVNLVEYGKAQPLVHPSHLTSTTSSAPAALPALAPPIQTPISQSAAAANGLTSERPKSECGEEGPPPPSPNTKPPELPKRPEGNRSVSAGSTKDKEKDLRQVGDMDIPKPSKNGISRGDQAGESSKSSVSTFLLAKRASLRPSPLGGSSYADMVKPIPSPPLSSDSHTSIDSTRSASDPIKPATKAKPSWLRRASGTAALRSKSKSPAPKEDGSPLSTSASLPPTLPPRKGLNGPTVSAVSSTSSHSIAEIDEPPVPPKLPKRNSYATIVASAGIAGSSRSRLADGQGRPAFSPPTSTSSTFAQPPPLPSRDNVGNIRNRLAAWTAAAQSSNSSFSRSESSNSIASQTQSHTASSSGSGYPQRFPASAQRVLGHAGSAVSKGWAGLRSRGVGGSISSMTALGQSSSSGRQNAMGPSSSWGSGMARRGSRDRSQSDNYEIRPPATGGSDGPVFAPEAFRRPAHHGIGRVFGRDVGEAGKEWAVVPNEVEETPLSELESRRRRCLPAVVIRAVEYLVMWGPKEEGIFRISGRSSHIARLRREFDAGADIDLTQCHPGDLDPHAVAGLFKSYLRELPAPLLTNHLAPKFDAYVKAKTKSPAATHRPAFGDSVAENRNGEESGNERETTEDLSELLQRLPQAHWFLLADIVKLLDLIPRHAHTNRMTLNALMLSLGPSLNISGGVLNELLDRQDELFSQPPSPSGAEAANDLIDFGETSIPPVEPPTATSTSSSWPSTIEEQEILMKTSSVKSAKKSPRLPPKPSLTKLFGSSYTSLPRQKSVDTLRSISASINTVEAQPPRVEIAVSPTSPLPTFESENQSSVDAVHDDQNQDQAQNQKSYSTAQSSMDENKPNVKANASDTITIAASVPIPATPDMEQLENANSDGDVQYPQGTVEERRQQFSNSTSTSTPIADKFSGTSSPFPSLRSNSKNPTSSNGSINSSEGGGGGGSLVNVIRRGPAVFFQSASIERERDRHGHGHGHGHGRTPSSSSINQSQIATATLNSNELKKNSQDAQEQEES